MNKNFASEISEARLPFVAAAHSTPILRKLKDVDMWYQYNKITNLKLAVKKLDGIVLKPNTTLSYWKLIGKPTKSKGYVEGMILKNGGFYPGIGGGLCQLSNLIFWMTLHTPLTVTERHRHSYDVFPDSDRTQPFGSGATCFYPYVDLMIKNDTPYTFQLSLNVGEKNLEGEWLSDREPEFKYKIIEKNHEVKCEYWGGYTRHNQLFKQISDLNGNLAEEQLVVENSAIMMYSPFLENN